MMETVFKIPGKVIVIDDFLEPDNFEKVRLTLAAEQYSAMGTVVNWNQGWSHGDGLGAAWASEAKTCIKGEPETPPPESSFDRDWEQGLNDFGVGAYVSPRPNRCVLTAPGVFHSVRVQPGRWRRPAAGRGGVPAGAVDRK